MPTDPELRTPDADAAGEPARAVLRAGLVMLALLAPAVTLVAGLARGATGAATAFGSVVLLAVWLAASALPFSWAARRGTPYVAAVTLGGYVLRVLGLGIAIVVLRPLDIVDGPVLAVTMGVGIVGLLATDLRELARHEHFWWIQPDADRLGLVRNGKDTA